MSSLFRSLEYEIGMEVWGRLGMFARPDTAPHSRSYPVPPKTAAKGMFESVLFMPTVEVEPTRVVICSPLNYCSYDYNSMVVSRKQKLIDSGDPMQIREKVLFEPRYQLYASVKNADPERIREFLSKKALKHENKQKNHAHAYSDIFNRYLKNGKSQKRLCLGRARFIAEWGGINENTKVYEDFSGEYHMPVSIYDYPTHGKIILKESATNPNFKGCVFKKHVIKNGVMHYAR